MCGRVGLGCVVTCLLLSGRTVQAADLSGVWDWSQVMRLEDGRIRAEREAWTLIEERGKIRGTCHRVVRYLAPEGKVFPCSGLRKYVMTADFTLEGTRRGRKLTLREVAVKVTPGPCETGERHLQSYVGRVLGPGRLRLDWKGGSQVLVRRNLTGVWWGGGQWTLGNGDTASWWEVWRIRQEGGQVVGIRDRREERHSNDGQTYRCNRRLTLVRQVRWKVQGVVKVDRLSVVARSPVFRLGPCERGLLRSRRLVLRLTHEPDVLRVEGVERSFVLRRQDALPLGPSARKGGGAQ